MRQHYNTTGSWLNKKMAILKNGLLFMQDFAWQRSTFYLLCTVWALLKREQGSTRDVRKTPQTVLITSHWTDYGLRTVVYVISKLAKCLELNQSMGLLVNDCETTRQSTYTWMEHTALSILAEPSPILRCDPYLENQIHCKGIRTITSAVFCFDFIGFFGSLWWLFRCMLFLFP